LIECLPLLIRVKYIEDWRAELNNACIDKRLKAAQHNHVLHQMASVSHSEISVF
jgi:hypothetical protein